MSQFEPAGFEDLRTYLQNNWNHIGVVDTGGNEQIRWDVSLNSNASFTSGPGSNPLTAQLTITGQDILDAGGSLPVTLTKTEVFKSSGSSTIMGQDSMTDATLEATGDEVVVTHDYEMPNL
jgi:hypothetical protein